MEQQNLTQTTSQLLPIPVPNNRRIKLANRNQWRCYWCNHGMRPEFGFQNSATIEHLLPRSQGGSNKVDNLQAACARCNRARGVQDHDEFMQIAKTFPRDRRSILQADLDHKAAKRKARLVARLSGQDLPCDQLSSKQRRRKELSAAHKAFKKSHVNPFEVGSRRHAAFEKLRSKASAQSLTFWQKVIKFVSQIFHVTAKNTA